MPMYIYYTYHGCTHIYIYIIHMKCEHLFNQSGDTSIITIPSFKSIFMFETLYNKKFGETK